MVVGSLLSTWRRKLSITAFWVFLVSLDARAFSSVLMVHAWSTFPITTTSASRRYSHSTGILLGVAAAFETSTTGGTAHTSAKSSSLMLHASSTDLITANTLSTTATSTTTSRVSWLSRWRRRERTREELKIGIAGFYDRSSKLWEDVWGEHMHHGYYVPANRTDHRQAQIDLIDQVIKWALGPTTTPPKVTSVVDVGCGIGGSSRHLARKYPGCTVQGITLSPYQAQRGTELALEQGLESSCSFQVADALQMPFADNSFDLVWSLESGEHMPDKPQFVSELFRVCQPGGRIILVTWTHRDLAPQETSLTQSETRLLDRINQAYYLPKWCSGQDYIQWLQQIGGATDVRREDWSYIIAPFWKAVIRSSLNLRSIYGLLRSGPSTIRGAYAMFLMLRGYQQGLIKFDLLTCTKPLLSSSTPTAAEQENAGGSGI